MFKFLKDKLKNWIKTSKKELDKKGKKQHEEQQKEQEKQVEIEEKQISEKPAEKEKKPEVAKKTEKQIKKLEKKVEKIEQEEKEKEDITQAKTEEPAKEEKSFFAKIKSKFAFKLSEEDFTDIFEKLEIILLENNVALEVVDEIKKDMQAKLVGKEIKKNALEEEITSSLKTTLERIMAEPFDLVEKIKSDWTEKETAGQKKPFVIVFFGINGSGKTTTISKIAHLLLENDISCVMAASDTFRAASIEQLLKHANNLGIKLIRHDYGADPSAVAYDAIEHAKAHKIKVVLIDTAGRMHTKENLMKEMEKICRVTKPDLKIFVGESLTGNDATEQARSFNDHIGIDGIILSKADVDEKGGTAISVSYVTNKPIIYLGIGQNYKDLEFFNKTKIIKGLGLE